MNKRRSFDAVMTVSALIFFAALVLICPAVVSAQPKEAPSVDISPASGAPGTALTITGKGFIPGEEVEVVLILEEGFRVGLGTEKVEAIAADQAGDFNAASAVPLMAKPGQYKIEIEGSKGSQATSSIEVMPKK
jgi:5'-nucleotidase